MSIFQPHNDFPRQLSLRNRFILAWSDGGGFKGFIEGTQRLSFAFWLAAVVPALLIAGLSYPLAYIVPREYFVGLIIFIFLSAVITRIFAWFVIYRCRKNYHNIIFGYSALTIAVLDCLYRLWDWSIFLESLVLSL